MKLKRILAGLLAASLALSGTMIAGEVFSESGVTAADNKLSSAQAIGANKTVSGTLSENTKSKSYKFTASEPGYLTFYVERATVDSTAQPTWKATVYDSKGISVSTATGMDFYTQTVVVDNGGLYYLVLENSRDALNQKYNITSNFTACDHVVAEPNDEVGTAVNVSSGAKYVGVMDSSSDADFFKISASKSGYARINLDRLILSSTTQPSWGLYVYDSDLNELYNLKSSYQSDTLNTKGLIVAIPANKYIVVKVTNGSNTQGVLYSFDSSFTTTSLVETEPNNTYSTADKLKLKKNYTGSLAEKNTPDMFYFKATKTGKYVASLKLSRSASNAYVVKVYDSKQNEIKASESIVKSGKITFKASKGKKYYVVVQHTNSYSSTTEYNVLYKLKVSSK